MVPTPLSRLIDSASRIVILTGAGISTESGISDYRSQGGLWDQYRPVTIQEFLADEEARREFWRRKKFMFEQMRAAKPNAGHYAIAELEKQGKLLGLITQNIDGLHQEAGSQNVLEIHGTNRTVICLECGDLTPSETIYQRITQGEDIPLCRLCKGLLKSNTISFGQELDVNVLRKAIQWSRNCDLMVAIGSTLVVEPAASLPLYAKQEGAGLIILNRDPTPLDRIADLVIQKPIGETLGFILMGE